MSDTEEQYIITDGVRRARAAHQLGKATIPAQQPVPSGGLGPVFDVPVDKLLSTKPILETDKSGFSRWRKMLRSIDTGRFPDGEPVPPIEVKPGNVGTPIGDVIVEGQDDLERFF